MQKDNLSEEDVKKQVEVPNLVGMTLKEAKTTLEKMKLGINYESSDEDISNKIITNQTPTDGIKVFEGANVIIEYEK